jgi:hypothetical protein
MNDNYVKKGLVVSVILLFIGIAIAPSINFNVVKASNNNDLVEFTTEACGIKEFGNNTVKLTQHEAQQVKQLFENIKMQLDNVKSEQQAVEIFYNAVGELDRFGLLGNLSIDQAKKLVTSNYKKSNLINSGKMDFFEKQNKYIINKNVFCLIAGRTNYTYSVHRLNPWFLFGSYFVLGFGILLGLLLCKKHPGIILLMPIWLAVVCSLFLLWIFGRSVDRMPLSFFNVFGVGFLYGFDDIWYAPGWVRSIGLFGEKKWDGDLLGNLGGTKIPYDAEGIIQTYPAVWCFNGLKIWLNEDGSEKYYLGSALAVGLDIKQ